MLDLDSGHKKVVLEMKSQREVWGKKTVRKVWETR